MSECRQSFNSVHPFRHSLHDIPLNKGLCSNCCSQMTFSFLCNRDSSSLKYLLGYFHLFLFHYQASFSWVRVVSICRASLD